MANLPERKRARRFALGPQSDRVRMGPISLFALVIIICLAVLSMLVFSTAHASLVMTQRQADAVAASYLSERAGQEFVAGMDDVLAQARGADAGAAADTGDVARAASDAPAPASLSAVEAAHAVEAALPDLCVAAQRAANGKVTATATLDGAEVSASFALEGGRALEVRLSLLDGGTYRIDSWKMSAVQNEEQPEGKLLIVG